MDCTARTKRSTCDFTQPHPSPYGPDRELLGTYFEKNDRDMQHLVHRSTVMQTTMERIEQQMMQTRSAMNSMSKVLETTCHALQKTGGCSKEDVSSCLQMHMQPLALAITSMREPLSTARTNMQQPLATKLTPRTDSMMKKFEQVLLQQVTYTNACGDGSMWSARKRVLANTQPVVTPDVIDGGRTPKTKDISISHSLKADLDSFREESRAANKELESSVVEQLSKQIRVVVEALQGLGKPHDALAIDLVKSAHAPLNTGSQEYGYGDVQRENVVEQLPKVQEEQKKRDDNDRREQPAQEAHEIQLHEDQSFAAVFMFDTDVEKPLYRVEDKYKKEGWAQAVARSDLLSTLTTVVVCFNAVWIGIEADHSKTGNLYNEAAWMQIITQFFVIYFVSEWFIRFAAFRRTRDAFNDGWFKFDCFMMTTMVLDTWIILLVLKVVQDNMEDAGTHKVKIPTQPFRVLRLLKLTRMARLMKAFPELVTMVQGLIRSLRAIASTIILVSLMSYIWGIVMHMLMSENDQFNDMIYEQSFLNFRTVFRCMWTLLMDGTFLLDNSCQLMTQMIFHDTAQVFLAGIVFCTYVFLTGVLILNMLIGVLCDLVAEVNQEQRNSQAIAYVKQVLLSKLKEVDHIGDGMIGRLELQQVMRESRPVIKKMGINELFLLQMEEMLYCDIEDARIPIKTVLDVLLMCRSSNTATVETLAGGFGYLTRELAALREQLLGRMPVSEQSIMGMPSIKKHA